MAEDIHNEGSEEEKKENSQQDEDFGLPDLEFEELEELDLNIDDTASEESDTSEPTSQDEVLTGADDIDMSVLDDIDVSENVDDSSQPQPQAEENSGSDAESALDQGIDEIEDVLDSAQLISDRLGDDDETEMEDVAAEMTVESSPTDESTEESINESVEENAIANLSSEDMSTESITGLTDEELEALMTPPEPVTDVESILSEGSTEVDDILASIDSPDDVASLGLEDDDTPPEVNDEDTAGSSLFAADDTPQEEVSVPDMGTSSEESDNAVEEVLEETSVDQFSEPMVDSDMSSGGSIFESDSIALQASTSETVEFQAPEEASLPKNYKPYTYEEATTGNFTKVIVIGVVIIGLIGTAFLYAYNQYGGGDEAKKVAKTEKSHKPAKKKPVAKKKESKVADASTKTESEAPAKKEVVKKETSTPVKKTVQKAVVAKTPVQTAAPGEIISITEKTGRVYAIIASFIDGDIAMDYANELSAQGKGVKIIAPFGNSRNYRVTIADYGSYSEATNNIDNIKADYGDQVWALKY